MAVRSGKTKAQWVAMEVARAVNAGKPVALETVDFSDPDRPKTCLEVDFPILPVNEIATIEGNAMKPVYHLGKCGLGDVPVCFARCSWQLVCVRQMIQRTQPSFPLGGVLRQPPEKATIRGHQGCRHFHGRWHDPGRGGAAWLLNVRDRPEPHCLVCGEEPASSRTSQKRRSSP